MRQSAMWIGSKCSETGRLKREHEESVHLWHTVPVASHFSFSFFLLFFFFSHFVSAFLSSTATGFSCANWTEVNWVIHLSAGWHKLLQRQAERERVTERKVKANSLTKQAPNFYAIWVTVHESQWGWTGESSLPVTQSEKVQWISRTIKVAVEEDKEEEEEEEEDEEEARKQRRVNSSSWSWCSWIFICSPTGTQTQGAIITPTRK